MNEKNSLRSILKGDLPTCSFLALKGSILEVGVGVGGTKIVELILKSLL